MNFEVFDLAAAPPRPPGPLVQVTEQGLLLNRPAWDLLGSGAPPGWAGRVRLLFDRDVRMAAMQPAVASASGSAVFQLEVLRGIDWPRMVRAAQFVEHYRIALGEFAARQELQSRTLTFEVGAERGRVPRQVEREPDGFGWPQAGRLGGFGRA